MGYFNPIFQYGIDLFCKKCKEVGIDGLIIPDLPPEIYISEYKFFFQQNNLINIFLITPQTSEDRIRYIDSISDGFIYMVSSSSITGGENNFNKKNIDYFKRIKNLKLNTPKIIGFGISNRETFLTVNKYANGSIIGSAFIKHIQKNGISSIRSFVKGITS
jgi:tryptophan synthase alpha chain